MSAKEKDLEIEDDLAKGMSTLYVLWSRHNAHVCPAQKAMRELKTKISTQSKRNFVLEKDVRYLDSRIALLIQNRLEIEEVII